MLKCRGLFPPVSSSTICYFPRSLRVAFCSWHSCVFHLITTLLQSPTWDSEQRLSYTADITFSKGRLHGSALWGHRACWCISVWCPGRMSYEKAATYRIDPCSLLKKIKMSYFLFKHNTHKYKWIISERFDEFSHIEHSHETTTQIRESSITSPPKFPLPPPPGLYRPPTLRGTVTSWTCCLWNFCKK